MPIFVKASIGLLVLMAGGCGALVLGAITLELARAIAQVDPLAALAVVVFGLFAAFGYARDAVRAVLQPDLARD